MHRDLVIRIRGHVRLACALEGPDGDAFWEMLPIYGIAARTEQGLLAFGDQLTLPRPIVAGASPTPHHYLSYCADAQRFVLPSSRFTDTRNIFARVAKLETPFPDALVDAVAPGTRISIMYADS